MIKKINLNEDTILKVNVDTEIEYICELTSIDGEIIDIQEINVNDINVIWDDDEIDIQNQFISEILEIMNLDIDIDFDIFKEAE